MKFRVFKQHKLWRDNLIGLLEQQGSKINWRRLNDEEFARELRIKFLEEASEVYASSTSQELVAELADVLEIIDSLCEVHQFSMADIIKAQHTKKSERGGFAGRKFVETAEHQVGSFGEKYCVSNPEKYPEIIE